MSPETIQTPSAPKKVWTPRIFGMQDPAAPPQYGFEARRSNDYKERCAQDTEVFFGRLKAGVELKALRAEDRRVVGECVETHVYNIYWYAKKLRRERSFKWFFFVATTALLFAIPVLILWVTSDEKTDAVVGQLGILFAGIFGVQKGLSRWVETRKFEGHFWRASSELKANLFQLQGSLKGKQIAQPADGEGHALTSDARTALEEAALRARKIVDDETQRYFDGYSVPTVDLSESLTSETAKSVIGRFSSPRVARDEALRQAEQVKRTTRQAAQLRLLTATKKIAMLEPLLAETRAKLTPSLSAEEKTQVVAQMAEWNKSLVAAHNDRIAAEAEVAAGL